MERAMECQSCWRNVPQERTLVSVLNPLQKPIKGQFINRHPGSLYVCLFKGRSPVIIPWALLHPSLSSMAHTSMQAYSGISQI